MRLRNNKNAKSILEESKYVVKNPESNKGKWSKNFGNKNPIEIEIGCGKGNFIIENALTYPDKNFIGIEMYDTVLMYAVNKIEKDIPNLRFIRMDARLLDEVFDKEIDLIYLNFSDPWPKDRHEKRRLTHKHFLDIYDSILKNKLIIQKTDNRKLFEYSICSLVDYGYKIEKISLDLHKDSQDIITTEYEEKFMKIGPIYMAIYKK